MNKIIKFCWATCLTLSIVTLSTQSAVAEPISISPQHASKNLFKPFQKSFAPAKVDDLNHIPVVLWTRMRNQFSLNINENDPRVKYYIKQFTSSQYHFTEMVNNARPYLHYILEAVDTYNMPAEIALLPMVESNYDPFAKSAPGARGLWQIMPQTGKYYGLSRNAWFDGCQDVVLSTNAALRHLDYLQKRFKGDWLHALAAYNSGDGRVARSIRQNIKENKPTDFWSLKLPKQTKDYVPKLMALATIVKNPSRYNVILPNVMNQSYFTQVDLGKAVDLKQAAKLANIPEKQLTLLNPGYHSHRMHPEGPFHICVPIQIAHTFSDTIASLEALTLELPTRYKIAKGDSLIKIAKRFKTNPSEIRLLNNLKNDTIIVGKYLQIPAGQNTSQKRVHVVQTGDSLWNISKKYKVNIQQIATNNQIKQDSILKPGQMLVIDFA
tara:strand:+ start:151337 stop:152650 length:1314 start_codon:yes stop_codon:yes gene_type:complete